MEDSSFSEALESMVELGFTHLVLAIGRDGTIMHICGYVEEPSDQSLEALKEELATDVELGMTGVKYGEDYVFVTTTREEIDVP